MQGFFRRNYGGKCKDVKKSVTWRLKVLLHHINIFANEFEQPKGQELRAASFFSFFFFFRQENSCMSCIVNWLSCLFTILLRYGCLHDC